jgi:small-conductance mechanosensitive channel
VVPGVYRVRLEVGGHQWEQPLTVMPDPRVSIGQPEYAAQFALAKALAEALDASTAKAQEVKSLRAQLKTLRAAQAAAMGAQAKELVERVNGDILSLYTLVREADAAPTRAQQSAADSLFQEWQSLAAASAKIWRDDLAPLNQALTRAKLPVLRSDAAAPEEGESTDEE